MSSNLRVFSFPWPVTRTRYAGPLITATITLGFRPWRCEAQQVNCHCPHWSVNPPTAFFTLCPTCPTSHTIPLCLWGGSGGSQYCLGWQWQPTQQPGPGPAQLPPCHRQCSCPPPSDSLPQAAYPLYPHCLTLLRLRHTGDWWPFCQPQGIWIPEVLRRIIPLNGRHGVYKGELCFLFQPSRNSQDR